MKRTETLVYDPFRMYEVTFVLLSNAEDFEIRNTAKSELDNKIHYISAKIPYLIENVEEDDTIPAGLYEHKYIVTYDDSIEATFKDNIEAVQEQFIMNSI
jgi:hypothetical protein